MKFSFIILTTLLLVASCTPQSDNASSNNKTQAPSTKELDPLPSWNNEVAKQNILAFVVAATDSNSQNFIPVADRIATFDNDGTLWSEQPMYFQLYFAIDRLKEMAAEHPEWQNEEPYKSVLNNDIPGLMKQGEAGLLKLVMTTHTGMSTDAFQQLVSKWVSTAKHPKKDKHFTELIYQPMLELIQYLKHNDFKVFIVSGGGIAFMRPWTEQVYGIPAERVIGSSVKSTYSYNNGEPEIMRLPELLHLDDKAGKPIAINQYIGKKPVFAAGNSDGDLEMMRWSASSSYPSFQLYIHHTDSVREWSYDRKSAIGKFDLALDEALAKNWTVVDMANDWVIVYPFEKQVN